MCAPHLMGLARPLKKRRPMANKRDTALRAVRRKVRKGLYLLQRVPVDFACGFLGTDVLSGEAVKPSINLNRFLFGDDLERGMRGRIYGPLGCGKTSFAVAVCVNAGHHGKNVLFWDLQGAALPFYHLEIGGTTGEVLWCNSPDWDQAFSIIEKLHSRSLLDLVVIDGIYRCPFSENVTMTKQERGGIAQDKPYGFKTGAQARVELQNRIDELFFKSPPAIIWIESIGSLPFENRAAQSRAREMTRGVDWSLLFHPVYPLYRKGELSGCRMRLELFQAGLAELQKERGDFLFDAGFKMVEARDQCHERRRPVPFENPRLRIP